MPDIREIGKSVTQAENKENRRIDPKCDAGITFLDLVERDPANGGALGHQGHGKPATQPGIANVLT